MCRLIDIAIVDEDGGLEEQWHALGDVKGGELEPSEMKNARELEMRFLKQRRVYKVVPLAEAKKVRVPATSRINMCQWRAQQYIHIRPLATECQRTERQTIDWCWRSSKYAEPIKAARTLAMVRRDMLFGQCAGMVRELQRSKCERKSANSWSNYDRNLMLTPHPKIAKG